MRTVTVGLGSFVAGAFFALALVAGIQTSIFVQPAFALRSWVNNPSAVPKVPTGIMDFAGSDFDAMVADQQQLDGIACRNTRFAAKVLTYGGGNFVWQNCQFDGVVQIKLTGAAANTMLMLDVLSHLRRPEKPLPNPNTPRLESVKLEKPATVTLATVSQ
jgi:hypothetical protein